MRAHTKRACCARKNLLLITLVAIAAIVGLGAAVRDSAAATAFRGASVAVNAIDPAAPVRDDTGLGFFFGNLTSPTSRSFAAAVPVLSLELSHSPATVQVGQELTLTDKVIAGPHSLGDVILTDTLPNEFTFLSGDAPGGACTVDTSGFFPIVTCPLGAIASGDSVTVNLLVRPNAMGGYTNNAYAKGFDGALGGTVFSDQWTDLLTTDPPQPSLSIDDVSHNEGDSGTTAFDFTVSLSNSYTSDVTVDYGTADGTATAPDDYQAATGTLTFTPGQTSKTVSVLANGDTSVEPDETFSVTLANASGATLAKATGTATIANDDSTPPTVILRRPADGATGVGTEAPEGDVNAAFSRAMDASTITSSSFTLTSASGVPVPATVGYDSIDDYAYLSPGTELDPYTTYTAKLASTIKASDGTPLAAPVTWSFTTGNSPPRLTSWSPEHGNISVLTHVTATFSRAMDASTITTSNFTLTKGGVPVPATISYDSNTNTAVLTPNLPLDTTANYIAGIKKTTIKAADGVPLHESWDWFFSTEAANTPTGTNVPVQTADPVTGTAIDVTFENVSVAGSTTLTSTATGPALPSEFQISGLYFELSTTASWMGPALGATICFPYKGSPPPSLQHYVNGNWSTVPTTVTSIEVCGRVTSFSPFALARDAVAPRISCASADGAWHSDNVAIACTAADGGVGLADAGEANFTLATSVPSGSETADAATGSRQVCDKSGNCATAKPIGGNKVDRKAPALNLPGNLVVNATSPTGAKVTYSASATDGTDPNPGVNCSPPSGATLAIATTTVNCTATDHAGNKASGSFTVTVKGAKEQLSDLIQKVVNYSSLSASTKTLLIRQLNNLLASFNPANATQKQLVCGALKVFIAAVQATPSTVLPRTVGSDWIADATRIRTVLAC
ncbi:MAG: Ig-like domain-containing protein [Gaiellaceae bacterium]